MDTQAALRFEGYKFFPLAVAATSTNLVTSSKGFNGEGAEVTLWDTRKPGAEPLVVLKGHQQDATAICFLDESRCASASKDGTVKVWDLAKGELEADVRPEANVMYTGLAAPRSAASAALVATTFQGGVLAFDSAFEVIAKAEGPEGLLDG